MAKTKLGIVGVGKIARDQHLPVLAKSPDFDLVAAASRNTTIDGVATYASLEAMLDAHPDLEAVSLCTPPVGRERAAAFALSRGVHVLLEKPPTASLSAARELIGAAHGAALHASWHSRHAPAVPAAREWLSSRRIVSAAIAWKEDIRLWHPGQDWILAAGGMGVFDPSINALSILTEIVPDSVVFEDATLSTPRNRAMPLGVEMAMRTGAGAPISASFDFLQTGPQSWDVSVTCADGELVLRNGGATLEIDGAAVALPAADPHHEYVGVYARFAECVHARRVDVDLRPLELVADAFLSGKRVDAPDFHF